MNPMAAVETGDHQAAFAYAVDTSIAIIKRWVNALVDSVMTFWLVVSILAIIVSFTTTASGLAIYPAANPPSLVMFYLLLGSLVFGTYLELVLPELGLFDEDDNTEFDDGSLSGFVTESFANMGAATYTSVVIWFSAWIAYELSLAGLTFLAPWALIVVPAIEIFSFYRFEDSILSTVSAMLMLVLTPFVFLTAIVVYAIRQTRHIRTGAAYVLSLFLDAALQSTGPSGGSILQEVLLIRRQTR